MRSEDDIRKKLTEEIDSYLTCPKFTVEEHAHNVSMLAWVLDVSDDELSNMIKESELSFGDISGNTISKINIDDIFSDL
ncbi:hypothetical protein [Butyrivibrio sp. XBB1001]|uniref:hypothetical protein n=1 Tax=Butyrivibrio sp. XBB1001 TaxID=1280682 RepID=UPI0004289E1D|nr:hypothetical protein [Butyrivibrio sp. XBB1001]